MKQLTAYKMFYEQYNFIKMNFVLHKYNIYLLSQCEITLN